MRCLAVFAFALEGIVACSSSTGPKSTSPTNVAGNWSGVFASGPGCPSVGVTLEQLQDTVLTGTWTLMTCDGTPSGGNFDDLGSVRGDSVYFNTGWGDFAGTVSGNTMIDSSFFSPQGGALVLTRD